MSNRTQLRVHVDEGREIATVNFTRTLNRRDKPEVIADKCRRDAGHLADILARLPPETKQMLRDHILEAIAEAVEPLPTHWMQLPNGSFIGGDPAGGTYAQEKLIQDQWTPGPRDRQTGPVKLPMLHVEDEFTEFGDTPSVEGLNRAINAAAAKQAEPERQYEVVEYNPFGPGSNVVARGNMAKAMAAIRELGHNDYTVYETIPVTLPDDGGQQ